MEKTLIECFVNPGPKWAKNQVHVATTTPFVVFVTEDDSQLSRAYYFKSRKVATEHSAGIRAIGVGSVVGVYKVTRSVVPGVFGLINQSYEVIEKPKR